MKEEVWLDGEKYKKVGNHDTTCRIQSYMLIIYLTKDS